MAVWFVADSDGEYEIWQSCAIGDYANGHIVGVGDSLDQAKTDAINELLADTSAVTELDESHKQER